MKQFKGIQTGKPLQTNPVQGTFNTVNQRSGEPTDEQQRVSYGEIFEVNEDTQRVKIDLFGRNGVRTRLGASETKRTGTFIPVMQPLQIIHHLYGSLRKGLIVRIWWRGKQEPGSESIAEIISDQDGSIFGSGEETARSNEIQTSPHEIFTGGTSSF